MNIERYQQVYSLIHDSFRDSAVKNGLLKIDTSGYGNNEFLSRDLKDAAVLNFKREVLGLCGRETFKTFRELTDLFIKHRLAYYRSEANNLVESINEVNGISINYRAGVLSSKVMEIKPISSPESSEKKYKISVGRSN